MLLRANRDTFAYVLVIAELSSAPVRYTVLWQAGISHMQGLDLKSRSKVFYRE